MRYFEVKISDRKNLTSLKHRGGFGGYHKF